MRRLEFTLVSDGSSDAALIEPLTWVLGVHGFPASTGTWADLARLPTPPKGLRQRIEVALDLYPCDLLFVHRDAESQDPQRRIDEVSTAVRGLGGRTVPVVPVRMQEAWLLIDEKALRRAAGNPGGRMPIALPPLDRLETIPDPKRLLHDLLREASGLAGRRLSRFSPSRHVLRLAELITDYSSLRGLAAFDRLENAVCGTLATLPDSPD